MSGVLRDLRFGLRMLAKSPTFTAIAVLTLALGIGATTAIFSVVNAVVLRPLPFPAPDRLVRIYTKFPGLGMNKFWMSPPEYQELARDQRSYTSVGAYASGASAVAGRDRPVRVPAAMATASLLPTIGVKPLLGRFFTPDEDKPGEPTVVVLGHGLWKRAFNGDPEIIGKTVRVDARPLTVVAVMPPGFDFPGDGTEVWVPAGLDPATGKRGNHFLEIVARMKPEVTLAQARGEIASMVAASKELHPSDHFFSPDRHSIIAYGLKDEIIGGVRWTLWLLQGAVLFVLLIACANISNLLLARAEARSREIAIRNALGAGRGRLVRQFLTEAVLLGVFGGIAGILVAIWGVDATLGLLPESAPRAGEIGIDWAVLVFALACALGTSLLFGLAPVLHTRVIDLHGALKEGQRTASSPRQRFRRGLVVGETALAVVLVIGCGLMIRSFVRLQHVDSGFRPDGLASVQVELPEKAYPDDDAVIAFWRNVQERVGAIPGVTGATLMTGLPPNRDVAANDIGFVGKTPSQNGPIWNVDFWQTVGGAYFETMGIKLVSGRFFTAADTAGAPAVVIINESFARKFYPGEDPLGQRLKVSPWVKSSPDSTIVGVVADVKQQGLDAPTGTEVYFTVAQSKVIAGSAPRFVTVIARGAVDPASLLLPMRGAITGLDPSLPVAKMRTLDQVMWEAVARPRFLTFLLVVFSGLALVLAAVGIYGVMSYSVAQRTRELGIRMALGAQAAGVRGLVLREGLLLAGIGVGVGLAAALLMNLGIRKVLAGVLFQVRIVDPITFALVAATVLVVSALACFIPAARATRVDPMVALRHD